MMLGVSRKKILALLVLGLATLGVVLTPRPALTILLLPAGVLAAGAIVGGRGFLSAWRRHRRRVTAPYPDLAYLPNLPVPAISGSGRSVFRNDFCRVVVDADGILRICDRHGEPLVVGIRYYTETNRYQATGLSGAAWKCAFDGADTILTISGRAGTELVTLHFRFARQQAAVTIRANVVYGEEVEVRRSALFCDLAVPLREVYRPGGACVRRDFAPSYWLDRQGALFGEGACAVFLSHVPDVSSLQVDTARRRLWINLDHERDHPYVSIPYEHDGTACWRDASAARQRAGDERVNTFALWVGAAPSLRPRLSCHPHGFLASFAWTEHACNTAIETQRAVFLGHSSRRTINEASAGFVKHRIPITKSVHYTNTQNADLRNQSSPWEPRPMLAIRCGNTEFLELLDALYATGLVEICLHCTDPKSASRAEIEASLQFMHERFASISWIDHIWWRPSAPVSGCRESFSCEGPLPGTPGFIADLWERFGIRYFWNNTFEYMEHLHPPAALHMPLKALARQTVQHLKKGRFRQANEEFWEQVFIRQEARQRCAAEGARRRFFDFKLRAMRGVGFPNPRYFRHPTRTGAAVHWPTFDAESGLRPAATWSALFAEEKLEHFSAGGETYFAHAYPTWAGGANGCVVMEPRGACRISPEFDAVLERMARFQKAGKINLATIEQLLDYWQRLEKIECVHESDGSVRVVNHNAQPVHGLTLVCDGPDMEFDADEVSCKPSARGWLFWFDLPARGCVTCREKGKRAEPARPGWPAKKCA